ncbi:4-alpha-glucanotransferase dpe2 [Tritrichomonas musculus]|uniref:4-alpha-glucanotransferase n=1 Tax=Tritrichomonas musculus TaxID=1915356 RepID=A0ABR2IQ02_9EUKA
MTVNFHLKINRCGVYPVYVYGSAPELGGGDITKAIPLSPSSGPYFYTATVEMAPPSKGEFSWYSYFFKPSMGSIIKEQVHVRFIPLYEGSIDLYDTFDIVNSVSDLVVHFRVRCFTHFGQHLYICGNIPELGNWELSNAQQMYFENHYDFWDCVIRLPLTNKAIKIEYKYVRAYDKSRAEWEPEENHSVEITNIQNPGIVEVSDTFRWYDSQLDIFKRAPFIKAFNRRLSHVRAPTLDLSRNEPGMVLVKFQMSCANVKPGQKVRVVGSCPELGGWDHRKGIVMADGDFPMWNAVKLIDHNSFPFAYKYVIVDGTNVYWESTENHYTSGISHQGADVDFPSSLQINDWLCLPNRELFKGLGVYTPLFSYRTKNSCGIGQYPDIKNMVDVCNKCGASLIQLLPINDTSDDGSWADSYPYRQTSCFALHPIYIDLLQVLPKTPEDIENEVKQKREELEKLPTVDYPEVWKFKMDILNRLFKHATFDDKFDDFVERNGKWLKPYALYCYFRSLYNTSDFHTWPEHSTITQEEVGQLSIKHYEDIKFTYWLQYICDVQFKSSRDYALNNGVVLKGDLPIGVFLNSVECWAFPKNFRMEYCAGAPPDPFSSDGQNWGFPTYDWDYMEQDNFSWWRLRLHRMAELYQVLRVDHVLGFFRIWEIPRDTCVRGMLGHYFPANPLSVDELRSWGLPDIDRYVKPYVRFHILQEKFGGEAQQVADKYFNKRNVDSNDDFYDFKPEYDDEVKVEASLKELPEEKRNHYRACLFQLLANVLLVEDPEKKGFYQVRTEVKIDHVEETKNGPIEFKSTSWLELNDYQRSQFEKLYIEFAYYRQTANWVEKAKPKLDMLKNLTDMLICAEDLGQLTEGILNCLKQHGFLSLRVQRMSKDPKDDFDHIDSFQYLSVCCPSTHDSSSLRGWWEENRPMTENYWRNVLWRHDQCPEHLTPEISEMILRKHLWSNSMWAIFLLQDLTGIVPHLAKLQTPEEERINIPADPHHKWRYRFPYTLEELEDDDEFNITLYELAKDSHRI